MIRYFKEVRDFLGLLHVDIESHSGSSESILRVSVGELVLEGILRIRVFCYFPPTQKQPEHFQFYTAI